MRYRCSWIPIAALTMTLLTASSLAADSLAIVWDDSHDGSELVPDELSGQYSEFAAIVTGEGHTLTELNGAAGALTPATLATFDVLMVFDAETAFTATEIADIQAYVAAGGKLFIAGDRPTAFDGARHNTLLAPYGLAFTAVDLLDAANTNPAFDLSVWTPDPITAGLTVVDFLSSGTLAVSGAGTKILGTTSGGHIGLASGADGAVVVLADADPFTNNLLSPGDDEEKLLKNFLGYFASTHAPSAPIAITLDIKPDGVPNSINPKSKGVVPVAILTTFVADGDATDFDPWDSIDVTTLSFGPGLATPDHGPAAEDVDFDGDLDMLLHFRTQEIGVQCGDTELSIQALTLEGAAVIGTDSITTPGCK